MNLFYNTISKIGIAEYKDKGSKFIAVADFTNSKENFKKKLIEVKKQYPKATHYCYAYYCGIDNIISKNSDNGEPSGTAGKPILNQILIKNLNNVSVIVVRYFGGVLLGVAGLIEAYKNVSSLALQVALIEKKYINKKIQFEFEFEKTNLIISTLKKYNCEILENSTGLFGNIIANIPLIHLNEIEALLRKESSLLILN